MTAVERAAEAWGADVIATGPLDFDETKFYVKSTDGKGHSDRLSFRILPEIVAQIQRVVHSPDFPEYESPGDFARDAIVHHLHRRRGQMGDPSMRETVQLLINELDLAELVRRNNEAVQRWDVAQENARQMLITLARKEAWGQVWQYLLRLDEYTNSIGEPFRSEVRALIHEWREKVPAHYRII